ncbi:MAG: TonB-dependent receptor [Chitinophagaceae bacterium]|nr:TonB-dependent receptor [Chitinophagaceae bacterium]MCA6455262.1 TonB-dependent receptor [Chitinophagaceae bacterium]MCA6460062.1 TonB-dependent receptor [Chitinophagaceae bacterium]MCA6465415.1 TonB-dependent receptor [Chitinophagaceae bacterium]
MHIETKPIVIFLLVYLPSFNIFGQTAKANSDTIHQLEKVVVTGYRTVNGVGHLSEVKDGVIYAGKKNEVIISDSLDANKAINNTRQILGRIPGLNIVETESSGFTANGIATRGLNPIQSIEMNTRQNGYNISGDTYGYNEAYYIPPMEGVSRIEMVRGAASLQFGSQFGGLVNYVTKDAPLDKRFESQTSITQGSYGLFNTFQSVGGSKGALSYYGFVQYRNMDGYRPSSQQWQLSGFGKLQYLFSKKVKVGLEYSVLRNRIQMPGGLTDSLFLANPRIATRNRNWLKSPWNIVTGSFEWDIDSSNKILFKMTYLAGNRSLVWRNEDGGPEAKDEIDPVTNSFVPREVGIEKMHNITTELRMSHTYQLHGRQSVLSGGFRYSYAWFKRLGGGEGSVNSDFDLSITGDWGYNLDFKTTNFAPFIENLFKISSRLSITPGFRFEYLNSKAKGYKTEGPDKMIANQNRNRYIPLFGLGIEWRTGMGNSNIYGNISQAYRPIDYSQLEPFGVSSKIDPLMKDASGFNADLGYRGTVRNFLNFDIGLFYMAYNNRIGLVEKFDPLTNNSYTLRTNIANSVHKGLESYVEFNLLKYLNASSKFGYSIFNSFAYIDAAYTSGEFKGKRVEAASRIINRIGMIISTSKISTTLQWNHTGDSYGDASNAVSSSDPVAGYIPAYNVLDFSGTIKLSQVWLKVGINNLTNRSYFTRRTDEYPGPGIIPAVGRSYYVGFTIKM